MAIETMMDDREIRNHLDFLGSTESDAGPLRSLKPSAGKPIPEFFKEFYDDLFRVTQSAPIIASNGATLDSLGSVQVGYASLHLDRYTGLAYANRRCPIGPPHGRINFTTQRPEAFCHIHYGMF